MPAKKTTRKSVTSSDPVTQYARDVIAKRVAAGPDVRAACRRHIRDLKEAKQRGLVWDIAAAQRVFGFFEDVLRLNGGQFEGEAFVLQPWQKFVLGSIFGWKKKNGLRRFRKAFVETGKGSGKSPMAAGIGLYMMMADSEPGAEVYAAAVDKEQAGVLFRDAVSMVKQSPSISKRITFSGGEGREWNIAYLDKGSFFRPISSESKGRGKSGFRPHCVLLDEIHEHPTNAMVEMMSKGTKGRRQALIFMITNSGSDRRSVCWEYHEYGSKVAAGELQDDEFFSYICGLDEKDDPLRDEKCWAKANPNLGVTFTLDYLRGEVRQARGMPSKQNVTLRLNFCRWTDAESAWIGREVWEKCEAQFEVEDCYGLPCFAGLDLSAKRDLTACARVWIDEDEQYWAVVDFWTPKDTLPMREDTDVVPYSVWCDEEYLTATPGSTVKYDFVADALGDMNAASPISQLGYDRYRIDLFRDELDAIGVDIELVEHGQGYVDMGKAVDILEELIFDQKINVLYNPVLRWNVASATLVEDPAGNRKFSKQKATGRIDGVVALAMAVHVAKTNADNGNINDFLNNPVRVQ